MVRSTKVIAQKLRDLIASKKGNTKQFSNLFDFYLKRLDVEKKKKEKADRKEFEKHYESQRRGLKKKHTKEINQWKRKIEKARKQGYRTQKKYDRRFAKKWGFNFDDWEQEVQEHENSLCPNIVLVGAKNGAKHYRVYNEHDKFLSDFLRRVKNCVLQKVYLNSKVVYTLETTLGRVAGGKVEYDNHYIVKKAQPVLTEEDKTSTFRNLLKFFEDQIAKLEMKGSGWFLKSVNYLDFKIVNYNPLKGGKRLPNIHVLPKCLKDRRIVINMNNRDEKCFQYSITRFK